MKYFITLLIFITIDTQLFCQNINLNKSLNQVDTLNSSNTIQTDILLLKSKTDSFEKRLSDQLEFYRDSQSILIWITGLVFALIGGIFTLFIWLFNKPNDIYKKLKKSQEDAKFVIDKLQFQLKHQETIFLLKNKNLFHMKPRDWDLVEEFALKASDSPDRSKTPNDFVFIGLDARRKGDLKLAKSSFQKAIELNNNFEVALKHLGIVECDLGEYKKSIKAFDKLITLDPTNDIAWSNKGTAFASLNDLQAAKKCYLKAIELDDSIGFHYTNYFELQLIQDIEFDPEILSKYLQKINNNDLSLPIFKLLKTFKDISNLEKFDLDLRLKEFADQNYPLSDNNDFTDIEQWISKKQTGTLRSQLEKSLTFFTEYSKGRYSNY